MSEVKKSGHSHHQRGRFSGKIGYVLAVAGSAVGLGNIWRFPYLAAKYGGGMFLLVYILLTVSFGYVLIMSETALGRMTRKSPVGAFEHFGKSAPFKIGGWLNAVIPMLIVPYYSTIGGWVIKYLVEYLKGNVQKVSEDGYCGFLAGGSLVSGVCCAGICHYPRRCKERRGAYVKNHDAGSGSSGCDRCHLFDDTSRCHGRSKIFPDPEL